MQGKSDFIDPALSSWGLSYVSLLLGPADSPAQFVNPLFDLRDPTTEKGHPVKSGRPSFRHSLRYVG